MSRIEQQLRRLEDTLLRVQAEVVDLRRTRDNLIARNALLHMDNVVALERYRARYEAMMHPPPSDDAYIAMLQTMFSELKTSHARMEEELKRLRVVGAFASGRFAEAEVWVKERFDEGMTKLALERETLVKERAALFSERNQFQDEKDAHERVVEERNKLMQEVNEGLMRQVGSVQVRRKRRGVARDMGGFWSY